MANKALDTIYTDNPIASTDFDGTELMYLVKSSADGAALVSALVAYIKTQLGTAAQKSALEFAPAFHRHSEVPAGAGGSVATDTIWDAEGDLALGSGADTAARLAIGANGTVLTSNGTTASWQTPVSGGGDDFLTVQAFS